MTAPGSEDIVTADRSTLRSVAVPAEHGGWGLTLEPGLLGLLVAPSFAGLCIALAAMVAFTSRTPLKIAMVDLRRGRRLERTKAAAAVGAAELLLLGALVVGAVLSAEGAFWAPLLIAAPLILVEVSYEVRSRGRRLVPELAGAIGVCSVAAMVVLADGGSVGLAVGAWLVLAARVTTSVPWVRSQIARLHASEIDGSVQFRVDAAALIMAGAAVWAERGLVLGAAAIAVVITLQRMAGHKPVPRPAVIGMRQMAMGFGVVLAAALGVSAPWS